MPAAENSVPAGNALQELENRIIFQRACGVGERWDDADQWQSHHWPETDRKSGIRAAVRHFEACALKSRENSSSFRSIERLKIFRLTDLDFGP